MRLVLLILSLVQFQVQASSDWLNRTVRVDLTVNKNGRAYDPQYDTVELWREVLSGVAATNGQYPWSVYTIAWADIPDLPGARWGQMCLSTIIGTNFMLTDFFCVGHHLSSVATSMEIYFDSVRLYPSLIPKNFVRHYWYIESSPENSPRLVLLRLHEPLTFTPNIQPIRLPSSENFPYEDWSSYVLGFQLTSGSVMANLRSTHASILNNNLCNFHGIIRDYEMCASDGSPGLAGTEGGAWVVYEYTAGFEFIPVAVGIHRFLNQTMSFVAASRVSHFVEWIETLQREY